MNEHSSKLADELNNEIVKLQVKVVDAKEELKSFEKELDDQTRNILMEHGNRLNKETISEIIKTQKMVINSAKELKQHTNNLHKTTQKVLINHTTDLNDLTRKEIGITQNLVKESRRNLISNQNKLFETQKQIFDNQFIDNDLFLKEDNDDTKASKLYREAYKLKDETSLDLKIKSLAYLNKADEFPLQWDARTIYMKR